MLPAEVELIENRVREFSDAERGVAGDRVRQLLHREIDYISNPKFESDRDSTRTLADGGLVDDLLRGLRPASTASADMPSHLRRICQSELLTQEQEIALFREMNYLKFQAHTLRSQLAPHGSDLSDVIAIESLLNKAQLIRNHIIQANLRLVMSVVKKFTSPQLSFDEMLSDGIITLMQAVDKFDFDRGFRFSTYAYRSIARTVFRSITAAAKEESRLTRDAETWAFEQADDGRCSSMSDHVWSNLRELASSLVDRLDRRERFIIRGRYALGAHRHVRTFQDLANKLGVSKERARQLEKRAVQKLHSMAAEFDKDELFGAAMQ